VARQPADGSHERGRAQRAARALEPARQLRPRRARAAALGDARPVRLLGAHRPRVRLRDPPGNDAALSPWSVRALELHPRVAGRERGLPALRPARAAPAWPAALARARGSGRAAVEDGWLERRQEPRDHARDPVGRRQDRNRAPRGQRAVLGRRRARLPQRAGEAAGGRDRPPGARQAAPVARCGAAEGVRQGLRRLGARPRASIEGGSSRSRSRD
jgi:hypothetical protein